MSSARGVMIPAPARLAFGAVQAVSQPLAARLAERWFFTPPRRPVPSDVEALLRSGRRFTLRSDGRSVVGWEWGAGPVVYLVHGWGSRGGSLGTFVRPLIEAGHRVVTFDAPGHGGSGRGLSSAPEFARALRAVADLHGPAHAVIGHSLGASASIMAAGWGLEAYRFGLLAPTVNPGAYAHAFARALGARSPVIARMRANVERRLSFDWSELDIRAVTPRLTARALIIHDHDDATVPFSDGEAIAASWPGAQLLPTIGLGHHGIVRDPGVVVELMRFVTGEGAGVVPGTESPRFERELFVRESR